MVIMAMAVITAIARIVHVVGKYVVIVPAPAVILPACWCSASAVGLAVSIRVIIFTLRLGVLDLPLVLVSIVGDWVVFLSALSVSSCSLSEDVGVGLSTSLPVGR